jgi:hypothetical protein
MKNKLLLFLLCSLSLPAFSQEKCLGLGTYFYPVSLGIRYAGFSDSDSRRSTSYAFEFRTDFSGSFAGEGNTILIEPELNFTTALHHFSSVSFMSGIGAGYGYHSGNENFISAYMPLVTEIVPPGLNNAFSVRAEGDLLFRKYSGYSTFNFRPMIGVVYNFARKTQSTNTR